MSYHSFFAEILYYCAKIPLQEHPGKDVKTALESPKSRIRIKAFRDLWNFQGLKNITGCVSLQWGQGEKDFPLVSARAAPDRPASPRPLPPRLGAEYVVYA
jgi:hypothetical protein